MMCQVKGTAINRLLVTWRGVGGGRVFRSPVVRAPSFSDPGPPDLPLPECFSGFFPSPFQWDRMVGIGWRRVFPFPGSVGL